MTNEPCKKCDRHFELANHFEEQFENVMKESSDLRVELSRYQGALKQLLRLHDSISAHAIEANGIVKRALGVEK